MKFSFVFFLRESLRTLRRNAAPSAAALVTVAVTLVVIGVSIPAIQALNSASTSVRDRVLVDVFMNTKDTKADVARVKAKLERLGDVRRVTYESKQQALAEGVRTDPTAYKALPGLNPLPDTFHVYARNPSEVLAVRAEIDNGKHKLDPSIQNVSNHVQDTQKVLTVTRIFSIGAVIIAALLAVASVFLIANTIRLSVFARRREVEVMKLVGATDWFIRWPFVIEGALVGTGGALVAICILGLAKLLVLDPLDSSLTLIAKLQTIPLATLLLVLLAAGMLVSAIGSGISLRRFLRV